MIKLEIILTINKFHFIHVFKLDAKNIFNIEELYNYTVF